VNPWYLYTHLLIRFTSQHVAMFGWVLLADLRLQSLAIKYNAEFTEGALKCRSNFKPFVNQNSWTLKIFILSSNALARLCISCFIRKAIKVAGKLRSRRKKGVLGPPICRGGYTSNFGQSFSNRTHFPVRGRFWSTELGPVADEKETEGRRRR